MRTSEKILRNLIDCLADWKLEKIDFSWEAKFRIGVPNKKKKKKKRYNVLKQ